MLLVEDMTTDGGSKVNFINALRKAGVKCDHTFVVFYYDIFPEGLKLAERPGRRASCAGHLVGRAGRGQEEREIRQQETRRGRGLHARSARLVESAWRNGGGRQLSP